MGGLEKNCLELVIIGSGPAAHTAAIYAGRSLLRPLLFEGFMAGGIAAGGQLTTTTEVENFPGFPEGILGPELMERMRAQSLKCGAQIRTESIARVDLSKRPFRVFTEDNEEFLSKSLIIATGATAKRLHLKGEDLLWQKGVSACAVCDGALPIFRGKELAVLGGGDTACEEASYLTKFASKVYMLVRKDAMKAAKTMIEKVEKNPKIEVIYKAAPVELKGTNLLEAVVVEELETGKKRDLKIAGFFYAIGHVPNTSFLEGQLELLEGGYIKTRAGSTRTSAQGVFAAGDVQDPHYRQAIVAAASGSMAAMDAQHFLSEEQSLSV